MQQYDKNIREKLHGHAVTPPPSVWTEIESNLPAPASRSNRLFWFLGMVTMLLVAFGVFALMDDVDVTNTADLSEAATAVDHSSSQAHELKGDVEEHTINEYKEQQSDQLQTSSADVLIKSNNQGSTTSTATIRNNELNKTPELAVATTSTLEGTEYHSAETGQSNQSEITGVSDFKVNGSSFNGRTENVELDAAATYPSGMSMAQQSNEDFTTVLRKYKRPALTSLLTSELESVNRLSTDWIGKKRERRMKSPCTYRYSQECYDFGGPKGQSHFYLDLLAGPDIYNRSITSKPGDVEMTDYAITREASETSELSWSAMVRGALVTESGFAVRTGFLYEQVNERFEASRRVTMITFDTINGVAVIDTISGTNTVTIYNKLKYLELPFMLGYEFHQERFTLGVNAGAALGLSFTQRGKILSPADNIVSITSNDNNSYPVYGGQARVNLLASLSLGYKLTPRMQLVVEPNFRYRLGSVTRNSYPLDQEYSSYGVWTGLRFRL